MIHDLDETLEALLSRELEVSDQVDISFATPDDQFPPSSVNLPAIDLFLYDVRENRELRTNEVLKEELRTKDGRRIVKRTQPPVRVDCSYLITAWSDDERNVAGEEHRLLGEVMKILLRHRRFPNDVLRGKIEDAQVPLRALPLQTSQLQSMGEFWQALGGKPKAALNYCVTISVNLVDEPETVRAVDEPVVHLDVKEPEFIAEKNKGATANSQARKARRARSSGD